MVIIPGIDSRKDEFQLPARRIAWESQAIQRDSIHVGTSSIDELQLHIEGVAATVSVSRECQSDVVSGFFGIDPYGYILKELRIALTLFLYRPLELKIVENCDGLGL